MTTHKYCTGCATPTPHQDLHCERCGAAWQPPAPAQPAQQSAVRPGPPSFTGAEASGARSWGRLVRVVLALLILLPIGSSLLLGRVVTRIDAELRRIEQQRVRTTDTDQHADDQDDEDYADDEDDAAAAVPRSAVSAVRVVLDAPAPGKRLSAPVVISGWAASPDATDGTGVDAVHVWLTEGGPENIAVLGEASYGLPRPDLVPALGAERFGSAGFAFTWDPTAAGLPPGNYALVAGARSGDTWSTATAWIVIPDPERQEQAAVAESPTATPVTVGGIAFQRVELERSAVYYQERVPAARVMWVAQALERAITEVPDLLVLPRPEGRVSLYLFANETAMKRDAATMEGWANRLAPAGGWYQSPRHRYPGIYLDGSLLYSEAEAESSVMHEYVHHTVYMAGASNGIDAWFNEGLAEVASERITRRRFPEQMDAERQSRLTEIARAQVAGTLLPLERLATYDAYATRDPDRAEERELLYAEGSMAVDLLARELGIAVVASVPAQTTVRRPWGAAFERALNRTPAVFDQAFRESLPVLFPALIPAEAPAGQRVYFVATGFTRYERIAMEVRRPDGDVLRLPAGTADDRGVVAASLRPLRPSPAGRWQVTLVGHQQGRATLSFTVAAP